VFALASKRAIKGRRFRLEQIVGERADLRLLHQAPFISSEMKIEPRWIDYNGHLNMAYYSVFFDQALDEALSLLDCGSEYRTTRQHSCFTAEVHVRYLRELHVDDAVRVKVQLLDFDTKRMRYFEQLMHASEGWMSATSESLVLHVSMVSRKTVPFPPDVTDRLTQMKAAHAKLPWPAAVGRRIAMSAGK
jgi:acyl-CoA thioester hydrolase